MDDKYISLRPMKMNSALVCECDNRYPAEIDSQALFSEIQAFFDGEVLSGVYADVPVTKPYYSWFADGKSKKWYADKWYQCQVCGCLWEFQYPDFPANGAVRKFVGGEYEGEEYHNP
jgi:hypothetical protein